MSSTQTKTDSDTKSQQSQPTQQKTGGGSSSTTSSAPPVKAQAVLTAGEIGRMIDLGLGRGVDATNPKPWINKTSFQVRRVCIESVLGTEEGGSMMSYEREITSVINQQTSLKGSIAIPQSPVTIGVDAELSRGTNTTRRAIGKKVLNRTISFRDDFEEVPVSSSPEQAVLEASAVSSKQVYKSIVDSDKTVADITSGVTFQDRLARWIIERILHRQRIRDVENAAAGKPVPSEKLTFTGKPVEDLAELIHTCTSDERKQIIGDCHDFVKHFRITHYISAVELGAAEYRVLNQSEYFSQVSTVGSLGLETLANFALTEKYSKKVTNKASEMKTIGKISTTDGTVERGSYNEAVVGVKISPITSLVKLRYLYLALRKALLDYMDQQGDNTSGPFIISCDSDRLFWKVNADLGFMVDATRDIKQASPFYILPTEDPHPYDFVIAYLGEKYYSDQKKSKETLTVTKQQSLEPVSRYLYTPISLFGRNSGPLRLCYHASEDHSRLVLNARMMKGGNGAVDLTEWVNGNDVFFISCAQRRFKKDGYIAVKAHGRRPNQTYTTSCVAKKSDHNDYSTWMLFRLIQMSYRDPPAQAKSGNDDTDSKEDKELKEYELALDRLESTHSKAATAPPGSRFQMVEHEGSPTRTTGRHPPSKTVGDTPV